MTEPNPEYLEGVICHKPTPGGQLITVILLTFGRARINLGSGDGMFYSSGW